MWSTNQSGELCPFNWRFFKGSCYLLRCVWHVITLNIKRRIFPITKAFVLQQNFYQDQILQYQIQGTQNFTKVSRPGVLRYHTLIHLDCCSIIMLWKGVLNTTGFMQHDINITIPLHWRKHHSTLWRNLDPINQEPGIISGGVGDDTLQGDIDWRAKKYKKIDDSKICKSCFPQSSWYTAKATCVALGGHLAGTKRYKLDRWCHIQGIGSDSRNTYFFLRVIEISFNEFKLRIQFKLNTALLSYCPCVRPSVCHRRDMSHFSHI